MTAAGPLEELHRCIEATRDNTGLTLILALSYGGRAEILDAVRQIGAKVKSGELDPESVIRDFRITAADGKNYSTKHYNCEGRHGCLLL